MKKNIAFTLAEILIVLVLIGVLSAILLPVAFQSAPNEAVMKFKKGHNTFTTVIKELVNSDKYYMDGDLGTRANGNLIDGSHNGDITYFCESFADIVSTKSFNCSENTQNTSESSASIYYNKLATDWESMKDLQRYDDTCKTQANTTGAEIVMPDGVTFYQGVPAFTFGISNVKARATLNDTRHCQEDNYASICDLRWFSSPNGPVTFANEHGFDTEYKLFCMDIDGLDKGEDPFAYGIRADGKILIGYKAKEWLEKSIQK